MADKNLLIEIIWDPSPIPVDEKIARSTLVIELPIGVMLGGGGGGGSGGDYIPTSEKGQAGGVAELDDNGKVPASQLPAAQTGDFIPNSEKGQPLGVATLAEDGLVDWRQLPAGPDLSGYVMTWQIGQPNGVADLDSSGMIPAFRMPALDFIPTSALGQPWGVAMLNSEGKVLSSQLPPFPDLNFVPMSYVGQNGGVAELDFTGKVPTTQLPAPVISAVNGYTGNVVLTAGDVNADPVGTAATLSTQAKNQAISQIRTDLDPQIANLQTYKLDKVDYVQHFRGLFTSYAALTAAIPVGIDGDYAHIDSGSGFDRLSAIWDTSDNKWVVNQVNVAHNTDEMPEGSNNLYFTGQRTRDVPLTGLVIPSTARSIAATDTILGALAQLQANFNKLPVGGDAVWVDSKAVGTWDAQQYTDQFTRLEFARWQGCIWVRGWMFLKNVSSTTYPFEITNPKYKIINPYASVAATGWIEGLYSGNETSAQTRPVSIFTNGQIIDASQTGVQQRMRGVISVPAAGVGFYVRPQALGIMADPS